MASDNETRRNAKLNLAHQTPEEIAKRVLETPWPERQEAKQKRDEAREKEPH